MRADTYVAEILPLLSLAAERRLSLAVTEPGAVFEARRPELDLALLRLMIAMPRGADLALRLRGRVLELGWQADEDALVALRKAGVEIAASGEGSALHLPQESAARS